MLTVAILTALASVPMQAAMAQDAATQADETTAEGDETTLSSIVVTAQKREEQLQNVPISIIVASAQLLQDTGSRDIKELQLVVPGLTVTSTSNEALTTARIRGIGTVGDNTGLESSVGIVIDGVYRPRNGVGFGDLGELERIEVLKGPQGTVFGKNTTAGVINVVTVRPSMATEFGGELTVGNYGQFGASAMLNLSNEESAAFRLYAVGRERDGFLDVENGNGPRTSDEDVTQDFYSFRAQMLFEPTESVDINFAADFTERNEECCAGVTLIRGPTAAIVDALAPDSGVVAVADPFDRVAYSNRGTESEIDDSGLSAELNWITPWLNEATLTSITAYRDWQTINGADLDYSTADIWYRDFGPDQASDGFRTWTQEFRFTGSTERFDWMGGLFYANEDLARNGQTLLGSAYEPYLSTALLGRVAGGFPPGTVNTANAATFFSQATGLPYGTSFVGDASDDRYDQNSKSLAFFTNNTWHATDALDLTLGLRYTSEEKEVDSRFRNPNGALGCAAALANPARVGGALAARGVPVGALGATVPTVIGFMCLPWANPLFANRNTHQELDEDEWSGTLKAAYRWNDTVMTYLSGARGYKAGGFNLDRVQSSNGTTSGAAGIVPVTDTSFPGEFVDSYELGAKTTWLDGNLLLNGALFWQDYEDFQLNSFLGTTFVVRSVPEVTSRGVDVDLQWQTGLEGLLVQGGLTYADTEYGDDALPDADLFLLPGSRLSFAPLWSGSAAATYEVDVFDSLVARFNIAAKYASEYNTGSDLDPQKLQDAYTVVNARIGLGSRDRSWMLELWAQNLTDEEYIQVGFDAPLQTGSWNAFLAAPRTYGLTLRAFF
ncbi:MAG: TonB-dependent receptor [Xanthomonadales bacterium]|nr:TonB-dependent receptor [Xanthomonadales bacterium]MBP7418192.1 TonB-dependent receptor [Xanthomonadales bacterium]